jgi:dihydroneopterin aldolase
MGWAVPKNMNMKNMVILLLLFSELAIAFGQEGMFAGDIYLHVSSIGKSCNIGVQVFGEEEPQKLIVDWGDNSFDTITGLIFDLPDPFTFKAEYTKLHIYQDTGSYTIRCTTGNWVYGITNFEHSGEQPFVLSATFYSSQVSDFSYNDSPDFGTTADYIMEDGGVIEHMIGITDYDLDSVAQR